MSDHGGGRDFTSRHAIMVPALLCCFIYGMLYFHLEIVCYSLFLFYQVRLLLRAGFTYNTCSGKPFARLHHSACKSQRTVLQPSGAIESFSYVVVTLRVASKILLSKKSIRERVSWTFRRNARIDFILFAMGITHLCIESA